MSDAAATTEVRPHPSLFTRVRVVETELDELKALVADLKEDHDALREDRDEWRWRAEEFLGEAQEGVLGRLRPPDVGAGETFRPGPQTAFLSALGRPSRPPSVAPPL